MLYTLKLKSGAYVRHCDDCWYETSSVPLCIFSIDQAKTIAEKMKKHHVYQMSIVDNDGNIIEDIDLRTKITIVTEPISQPIKSFRKKF